MNAVVRRIGRPAARAATLVEALLVVGLVEVGLRTARLPRLAGWCGLEFDPAAPQPQETAEHLLVDRLTGLRMRTVLKVLARGPFPDTCLRRALVLGHMLRRRRPRLLVGVAKHDGELLAHAWVVVDGTNLDPMVSRDYTPFAVPPGGADRFEAA